jgi:hypothetical protein
MKTAGNFFPYRPVKVSGVSWRLANQLTNVLPRYLFSSLLYAAKLVCEGYTMGDGHQLCQVINKTIFRFFSF